ncbi:unnamed protein product [Heligmosomoides polygyrus]|uniref:Secreted protein n=1 Tax=Heligmosomoides polygyrus TaxID=6339 RepID=A0A183FK39_HELPZ|nr:unnamed protein product [Heligmosomoides polygyrus]
MSWLRSKVVLAVLLTGAFTAEVPPGVTDDTSLVEPPMKEEAVNESFELPPEAEWLPGRDSKEPIDGINAALQTMLPLLEPLKQSESQALQNLAKTVSANLGKEPGTRTEKDYANIMDAARSFVRLYWEPRLDRHSAHDVRVLQVFTTWVSYVVGAFRDSKWTKLNEAWPAIEKEAKEGWHSMADYVKKTKNGTALDPKDNYAIHWIELNSILYSLIRFLAYPK